MDKSANRNHGKTRSERRANPTPITGLISDAKKAEAFVADIGLSMPAIRKFSRQNWKQIALVSAGISVLAAGAYFYFSQQKKTASKVVHH